MEQVFKPSLIQFTSTKSDLNEFEKNNPTGDEVVKCLLRTYSGIFDIPVRIDEMQLASILKINYAFLITQLEFLNKNNIIEYSPRRETPQIVYLQNRIKTEELTLNYENYLKRKNQFIERINAMINYCNSQTCRSTYIGKYFGDVTIVECGKCDNCTRKNETPIQSDQFSRIYTDIQALLLNQPLNIKALDEKLGITKEALHQVLSEMKKEEKIGIDHNGKLFLK
jgi:ATP-dependent DNA helicase RecQ